MEQLQCRFYARDEISEIINVDKSNHHFNDKVKTTLTKWGYSFEYSRKGVLITRAPENAVEKLNEILIRKLNIDTRTDCVAFAFFLYLLAYDDGFASMPWIEREGFLKDNYDIKISERTLRAWAHKLIDLNIVCKVSCTKTYWKTDSNKVRTKVEKCDKERIAYWESFFRRQTAGEENIMKSLWNEFGCCFYSCAILDVNAFPEIEVIEEIYDLVRDIASRGVTEEVYRLYVVRSLVEKEIF